MKKIIKIIIFLIFFENKKNKRLNLKNKSQKK